MGITLTLLMSLGGSDAANVEIWLKLLFDSVLPSVKDGIVWTLVPLFLM
jgi:hypothetical protein